MDFLTTLLLIAVFLFSASIVGSFYLIWTESRFAQKKTVKRRLLYISAGGMHGQQKLSLYKERALKEVGPLARLSYRMPRISGLDKLLVRSRVSINATTFILTSISLGMAGFLIGAKLLPQIGAAILLGAGMLCIPYLLLKSAEKSCRKKFTEQLPESLDLLARALRTGHAITAAMEIVAEEMEEPIKSEFASAVDEIKFGLTLEEAVENLCDRVPVTDLRFFAVTVIIHKESGGNIAEVFDNLSRLIRERLQFKRQVKALTAEGRLSAIILFLLPIAMFLYLYLVNYDYVSLLWTESIGRIMVLGAILAQIVGFFVMKKLVEIEI